MVSTICSKTSKTGAALLYTILVCVYRPVNARNTQEMHVTEADPGWGVSTKCPPPSVLISTEAYGTHQIKVNIM